MYVPELMENPPGVVRCLGMVVPVSTIINSPLLKFFLILTVFILKCVSCNTTVCFNTLPWWHMSSPLQATCPSDLTLRSPVSLKGYQGACLGGVCIGLDGLLSQLFEEADHHPHHWLEINLWWVDPPFSFCFLVYFPSSIGVEETSSVLCSCSEFESGSDSMLESCSTSISIVGVWSLVSPSFSLSFRSLSSPRRRPSRDLIHCTLLDRVQFLLFSINIWNLWVSIYRIPSNQLIWNFIIR